MECMFPMMMEANGIKFFRKIPLFFMTMKKSHKRILRWISTAFLVSYLATIFCFIVTAKEDKKEFSTVDRGRQEILKIKESLSAFDQYDEIYDKNLFHPERRLDSDDVQKEDPSEQKDSKVKDSVKLPNLRLIGTLTIGGIQKFAYIINSQDKKNKGKAISYKEGDFIGAYCISEIMRDRVVLTKESEVAVIRLKPMQGKSKSRSGRRNKNYRPSQNQNRRKKSSYSAARGKAWEAEKRNSTKKTTSRKKRSSFQKFSGRKHMNESKSANVSGADHSKQRSYQSYSCGY